jgi:hypothetical protein
MAIKSIFLFLVGVVLGTASSYIYFHQNSHNEELKMIKFRRSDIKIIEHVVGEMEKAKEGEPFTYDGGSITSANAMCLVDKCVVRILDR